jgi:uncharacterized damage-inducible protein DinB
VRVALADILLPEFDHEMGVTRRLLARVPDGEFAWKPHDKSMTLGRLAEHVAEIPTTWVTTTIEQGELDLDRDRPEGYRSPETRDELLVLFDRNVAAARAALTGRTDAELAASWALKQGGTVVFTMPKAAVLRSYALNHMVHHRGQLSVYLRLRNVPVPAMYGPTADEAM